MGFITKFISRLLTWYKKKNMHKNIVFSYDNGYCPICESRVTFASKHEWFRDHLLCSSCLSIPRERALMYVIKQHYPNYKNLIIHESSPGSRGTSIKLNEECSYYTSSFYNPDIEEGHYHPSAGYQSQNLENLTFKTNSIDLFITQDVMEHVFNPAKAFREIARVLKPGGSHIFTVPLVNKENKTVCMASLSESNEIVYHHEPEYHGNPIDRKGSLVTMHWGYDLVDFIQREAGTPTTLETLDKIEMGIRAEYIDVVISKKTNH